MARGNSSTGQELPEGHTAGPYSVLVSPGYINRQFLDIVPESGTECLARVFTDDRPEQAWADARLFAAAPELLHALEKLVDAVGSQPTISVDEADRIALAAIAKARGA